MKPARRGRGTCILYVGMHTQMSEKAGQAQLLMRRTTNLEDHEAVVDAMRSSKIKVRIEDLGCLEGSHCSRENRQKWRIMNYEQAWNEGIFDRIQSSFFLHFALARAQLEKLSNSLRNRKTDIPITYLL